MTPEKLYEITERVERRFGAFIRADALDLIAALNDSLARERALSDLLAEARDKGLIYWEPNTTRGTMAKMEMLARIDTVLAQPEKVTP